MLWLQARSLPLLGRIRPILIGSWALTGTSATASRATINRLTSIRLLIRFSPLLY